VSDLIDGKSKTNFLTGSCAASAWTILLWDYVKKTHFLQQNEVDIAATMKTREQMYV